MVGCRPFPCCCAFCGSPSRPAVCGLLALRSSVLNPPSLPFPSRPVRRVPRASRPTNPPRTRRSNPPVERQLTRPGYPCRDMCLMVLSVGCSVWWRRPRQRRWRRPRRWAGLPGPGLATAGAATVVDPTGKGGGVTGNGGGGVGRQGGG